MAEEFKRLDRKLVYHGTIIDYYRDSETDGKIWEGCV